MKIPSLPIEGVFITRMKIPSSANEGIFIRTGVLDGWIKSVFSLPDED